MSDKKFKDTKVGTFLKKNVPQVLDVVGDVLPDKGVLGIVKNIISKDDAVPQEVKDELNRLIELEYADIDSARHREVAIATSEHVPFIVKIVQPLLAMIIVTLTFALFYMIMFRHVTNVEKDILIYVLGALTTYVGTILSYYFGSSSSSKRKDEAITQMIKGR